MFVESVLRQAASFRDRQGTSISGAIHHSDAGSPYTSVGFGEALFLAGLTPSIGSVGDAYDNDLCETIIGLDKSECIRADSPFRTGPLVTVGDLERTTAAWVHWYNNHRLIHRLGRIPPAEYETSALGGFARPLQTWSYTSTRCRSTAVSERSEIVSRRSGRVGVVGIVPGPWLSQTSSRRAVSSNREEN